MPKRRNTSQQRGGYRERRVETRELRQRFLVVCEGEKTEPRYFANFHLNRRVVPVDIRGMGSDPLRLVAKARQLREEEDYTEEYDQVWVVFDCDDFAAADIDQAVQQARKYGIRVAYSNQAFELWYLLHFNYYNTAMPRGIYNEKLSQLLGRRYVKNSDTIYRELENRQPVALANARRLLSQYDPPNPATDDPSTTVHELVEQLNRFLV